MSRKCYLRFNDTINLILPSCFSFPTQKKTSHNSCRQTAAFLPPSHKCVGPHSVVWLKLYSLRALLQRLCWYDTFATAILEKTLLQRPSWQDPFFKAFLARPFCKGLTLLQRPSWKDPFAKALLAAPFHKGGHMCSHMHAPIGACTASLGAILQTKAPPNACKWHPFPKVLPLKGTRGRAYPSTLWLLLCSDSPFSKLE